MSETCWFSTLPGVGPCHGHLMRCHLISQQTLRRELRRKLSAVEIKAVIDDRGTWVAGCDRHHHALDYSRKLRIPRELLPPELEQLCAELSLTHWLDREYGRRQEAA